jgi:hypothetical protein
MFVFALECLTPSSITSFMLIFRQIYHNKFKVLSTNSNNGVKCWWQGLKDVFVLPYSLTALIKMAKNIEATGKQYVEYADNEISFSLLKKK